jgi:3-hydroxyisobutyrate dehydrogenase-like beta-hydroxyacid dehydrogenase
MTKTNNVGLDFHKETIAIAYAAGGNYETHFSLANMGEDSRYRLAQAESAGLDTPAIAAASRRMMELSANGLGDREFSAVGKPYLQDS